MPKLISGPAQLETTHAATCKGFLELASAKSQKAAPYIKDAVEFWDELAKVNSPQELLKRPTLRDALISTAGVSAKTLQYLQPADVDKIIVGILDGISPERRKQFREEVFYRYLLTRGASLDGEMRNYIGAVAAMIFVVAVVDALQVKHDPSVYFAEEKTPKRLPEARTFARTHKTQKIEWEHRTLLFDKKPGIIGKNVDAILLNVQIPSGNDRTHLDEHKRYVACGELKGGIDPAGADEHWKTAVSALDRISKAFASKNRKPALFFVGAAIEAAMAKEIFARLQDGRLSHAANLTVPKQVADLAAWLVSL